MTIRLHYGNQIYTNNNNSCIKGNGRFVCGAIGHETLSVLCNYNNFISNNNSYSIFGFGGTSLTIISSFSNFILNYPSNSLISNWVSIILDNIIFKLNLNQIRTGVSGSVTLTNCISDTNYLGSISIGTNCVSNQNLLNTINLLYIQKCNLILKTNTKKSKNIFKFVLLNIIFC